MFNHHLIKQIFLFGIVGTIGFVVDTIVLYCLKDFIGLIWGRGISFCSAVIATWLLNRNLTFKKSQTKSHIREFTYYFSAMILGGCVNLLAYYIAVNYKLVATNPIIGVAIGSIAGMVVNFISSKWFIFK